MPGALFSVWDKTGIVDFARQLQSAGWDLIASGGTARVLVEAGLSVQDVAGITGEPEMLDGRVKTLHPAVHAALLARDSEKDMAALRDRGWKPIDLVVVNLYPFEQVMVDPNSTVQDIIEHIDIGGVALLRAAAKNYTRVTVLCDPEDYHCALDSIPEESFRLQMAHKAFVRTAAYDAAIGSFFAKLLGEKLPFLQPFYPSLELRYGENPHQSAVFYSSSPDGQPLGGELLQGKALSYNNLLDLDAAWRAVVAFSQPAAVVVKHTSPCGIAIAQEASQAILQKKQNLRLLRMPGTEILERVEFRSVLGGLLQQATDFGDPADTPPWQVVTHRQPTEEEMKALQFAWVACQHVKSNSIVLARSDAQSSFTVGVGGGQPSRVDSVRIAGQRAGEKAQGSVLASDAFFPFPDGVVVAADLGVTAIIQPGGSVRDESVIKAANDAGMAMIFTGVRHFKH